MTTSTEKEQKCFTSYCKNKDVSVRSFPWYCVPKRKYNEASYWTTLEVDLCSSCFAKTKDCKSVTGWDWWDAADHLDYQYLQEQSYRDHYDKGSAKIFGFSSVDDLRQARQANMNAIEDSMPEKLDV